MAVDNDKKLNLYGSNGANAVKSGVWSSEKIDAEYENLKISDVFSYAKRYQGKVGNNSSSKGKAQDSGEAGNNSSSKGKAQDSGEADNNGMWEILRSILPMLLSLISGNNANAAQSGELADGATSTADKMTKEGQKVAKKLQKNAQKMAKLGQDTDKLIQERESLMAELLGEAGDSADEGAKSAYSLVLGGEKENFFNKKSTKKGFGVLSQGLDKGSQSSKLASLNAKIKTNQGQSAKLQGDNTTSVKAFRSNIATANNAVETSKSSNDGFKTVLGEADKYNGKVGTMILEAHAAAAVTGLLSFGATTAAIESALVPVENGQKALGIGINVTQGVLAATEGDITGAIGQIASASATVAGGFDSQADAAASAKNLTKLKGNIS